MGILFLSLFHLKLRQKYDDDDDDGDIFKRWVSLCSSHTLEHGGVHSHDYTTA
jgi:hypothetical protein